MLVTLLYTVTCVDVISHTHLFYMLCSFFTLSLSLSLSLWHQHTRDSSEAKNKPSLLLARTKQIRSAWLKVARDRGRRYARLSRIGEVRARAAAHLSLQYGSWSWCWRWWCTGTRIGFVTAENCASWGFLIVDVRSSTRGAAALDCWTMGSTDDTAT